MDQFPPGGKPAPGPAEPKRVERVVSATAERRQKSLGRRFKETFVGGDAKTAVQYAFFAVVIPSAKDMLFDAFHSGLERLIYGELRARRGGPTAGYSTTARVDYRGMSSGMTTSVNRNTGVQQTQQVSRGARARHDFGEIVIKSRPEADEVLNQMFTIMSQYGSVNVADLYALTGIRAEHTDVRWGWTSLPGAKALRLRDGSGYLLDLPDPQPLG